MANCPDLDAVLVLPHLRVQNANAISSPLTHGFPAMTAFIGLMWALERKAQAAGIDLRFPAVGVVVHRHEEQVSSDRYLKTLRLARHPNNKEGKPSAIVEEGRIHLDLTLLLAAKGDVLDDQHQTSQLARQLLELLQSMRIAGGSLIPPQHQSDRHAPYFLSLTGNEDDRLDVFASAVPNWLPGFTLVERTDLLQQRHADLRERCPDVSSLDAWLSLSRINWYAKTSETGKIEWHNDRQGLGWIVPLPLGYTALTDLQPAGSVPYSRDDKIPMRWVESVYGIGQWISPHHLDSIQQLLWYPTCDPEQGLYRCHNDYEPEPDYSFD
ncbi:type I-F CRISPR-associated protein Csy2 [Pseudomonas juntendi]|uniref:type I-F CRISPR-associated protein Csy2 n=1 Tax=Pseudomonas juntendi TaxID=2666183 RepID=UPI0034D52299